MGWLSTAACHTLVALARVCDAALAVLYLLTFYPVAYIMVFLVARKRMARGAASKRMTSIPEVFKSMTSVTDFTKRTIIYIKDVDSKQTLQEEE